MATSSTVKRLVCSLMDTKLAGVPAWAAQTLTKQNATAAATEFVSSYKVHTEVFVRMPVRV
jgi:hypothetical protein